MNGSDALFIMKRMDTTLQEFTKRITMKIPHMIKMAFAALAMIFTTAQANAQYYEIANQIPRLISPALSGSFNYKGFLEAGYSKTFGSYDADFLEISTSQGFRYADWFYMGVGIGVDVLFAHKNEHWGEWGDSYSGFDHNHSSTTSAAMLPIFSDFRFNIGGADSASFFIDLKIGCSFLLSRDYIEIGGGYLTNQQYFYLRPAVGIRIPTNANNPKQAVNLGVTYKLLTSNYWSSWERNITLNSLGAMISYEW